MYDELGHDDVDVTTGKPTAKGMTLVPMPMLFKVPFAKTASVSSPDAVL